MKVIFAGLTQNITKVEVIHELPLRKNKVFGHILRKFCFVKTYTLFSSKEQLVCLRKFWLV
ncbi:hypothetical protein B4U84_17045 [Westiellopsis prolifica IICB1]|nr:hypothetical protein B4U84_17045 [Westiellopsis prolifica IICB1]